MPRRAVAVNDIFVNQGDLRSDRVARPPNLRHAPDERGVSALRACEHARKHHGGGTD